MEMVLSTHEMDDGYTTGREAKAFQVFRLGQAEKTKQTSLMVAGKGKGDISMQSVYICTNPNHINSI